MMNFTVFVIFMLFFLIPVNICVPMTVLSNDISASFEEDEDSPQLMDDDMTTRGLARLSSAATCLVAGVEYTHGQQIYRADPCEFCLCLDGEMFCWWQDCPPAIDGPCKNQGPFSQCASVRVNPTIKSTQSSSQLSATTKIFNKLLLSPSSSGTTQQTMTTTTTTTTSNVVQTGLNTNTINSNSMTSQEQSNSVTHAISYTENFVEINDGGTEEPLSNNCIVMGQQYKVGDNLPHSTGNCLECICGPGGKITCSPHQCVPAGDEIMNDFRAVVGTGRHDEENDVFIK